MIPPQSLAADTSSQELAAYTLTRGDADFIHQHQVDARGASEDLPNAKPIRIFFALAGLYLMLEKNYTGWQVQAAHIQMARQKHVWPVFVLPHQTPSISATDVMQEPFGDARDAAIHRWCQAVWEIWSAEHSRIRNETDTLLEDWQPPKVRK